MKYNKLSFLFFILVIYSARSTYAVEPILFPKSSPIAASNPTQKLLSEISTLGRAGGLTNPAAVINMSSFIYETLKAAPKDKYLADTVPDYSFDPEILLKNPDQPFKLTDNLSLSGNQILDLQKNTRVYFNPKVYHGAEGKKLLRKTLAADTNPQEAYLAKHKVVVSKDYMLFRSDRSLAPSDQRVTFKTLSQPGINVAYGKNNHDHLDFQKFVKAEGELNEAALLKEMVEIVRLHLEVFQREGVEIPVLPAIGGGSFSRGFQPRYTELLAEAYKTVLTEENFKFKGVVFALPKHEAEGNFERFQAALSGKSLVEGCNNQPYHGKTPIILADTDLVETAHKLGSIYPDKVAILNPADSYSIAGMYWERGNVALEESLAFRTTLLLTQHLRLNPALLDAEKFIPVDEQGLYTPHAIHACHHASAASSPHPHSQLNHLKHHIGNAQSVLSKASSSATTPSKFYDKKLNELVKKSGQAILSVEERFENYDPTTGESSGPLKSVTLKFASEKELRKFSKQIPETAFFSRGPSQTDDTWYIHLSPEFLKK